MEKNTLNVEKNSGERQVAERTRDRRTCIPRVDIYETGNDIVILADMPEADEKSVTLNLDKDVLTIEASIEEEHMGGHTAFYSEYGLGDYYRAFTVSDAIDREKIEARMKDGVLRVVLPKAGPAKARKISVNAG